MPAYLPGWDNRVKIVIDHSLIDAALVDFPVAIPISASCGQGDQDLSAIFDELETDANRTKIAVTTDDGQTQCYVEIENWDDANELAMLHVKVPAISADEDTILYLYYDAEQTANTDFVGDTGDTPAQSVWDSDFEAVYHLAQDPSGGAGAILDSTSNGNDGTSMGSMTTGDLVDGQVDGVKAINFDGVNDGIACGNIGASAGFGNLTLDVIARFTDTGYPETTYYLLSKDGSGENTGDASLVVITATDKYRVHHTSSVADVDGTGVPLDNWMHVAYQKDGTALELFEDGVSVDSETGNALVWNNASDVEIGTVLSGSYGWVGDVSEVRISSVTRSDAWIKATYHTLFDTLLTWQTVDFDNRFKITIDHNSIDADLTDFPVMIKISDDSGKGGADLTAIFDELITDAERFKIAVTTSDGQTQCPVEIEYWDVASETAILHTKVPAVDDDVSTVLYLHYDADVPDNTLFVGDTGDAIAQTVWDDDFESVHHLVEQGDGTSDEFKDSTINANHGQADGGAGTIPTKGTSGPKGVSQDFDGGDWITYPISTILGAKSIEVLGATDGGAGGFWDTGGASSARHGNYFGIDATGNEMRAISSKGSAPVRYDFKGSLDLGDSVFRTFSHVWDGTTDSNKAELFVNGVVDGQGTAISTETVSPSGIATMLGGFYYTGLGGYNPTLNGNISEVRVSAGVRSAAWLKATYHTLFDTLLSFGLSNGYLPGFKNRVQVDIDSSLIDADLTDFPVTLHLSEAAGISGLDMRRIFEVIQTSGDNKKIAVTTADGLTQCPVEIEYWDHATKTAVLHVKVPHVESSADTVLYLYFDNSAADNDSFVGDTGDAVAQGVWDDDFVGVWHMAQDPNGDAAGCILDSTDNGNDGTPAGTMTTADLVDDAVGGKAIDFDGGDDRINCGSDAELDDISLLTAEAVFNATGWGEGNNGRLVSKANSTSDGWEMLISLSYTGLQVVKGSATITGSWYAGTVSLSTWYHAAFTLNDTSISNDPLLYLNGAAPSVTQASGDPTSPWDTDAAQDLLIGARTNAPTDREFNGKIGEVRISSVTRSAAWIKATYHTLFGTLVTFSNFQSSEFKKRRMITIDSDLIDEPLVDFPLAIPLGTSAGIGDEDLSDIFAELKFPASDPFFGGSAFDTTRWEIMGQAGNVSMSGNALQCLADSGDTANERQGVLSKFKLDYTEDFDIRVDFEVTAGPATDYWFATLEAYFWDQAGGSVGGPPSWDTGVMNRRGYNSGNHIFSAGSVEDASWNAIDDDIDVSTKGQLRIVFNAATPSLSTYYNIGAGWVLHATDSLTDVDATDALIMVGVYTGSSSPTVTVEYKNFQVYTGKVKWPDGEPNRKKLKVTLDDLITECPVEIEHLDVDGQAGILHTKIPYISAAEDTEIYLHYDCDQPDNSNVGDIGDAIAQTVWDDNFIAVYHLCQDPSGGAGCILDSTVNGLNATPNGSMTAADLVDGLEGSKGIDFDGSGDYLSVADNALLDVSELTMEAVYNSTDVTNEGIFFRGNLSSDQGDYQLSIAPAGNGYHFRINGSTDEEVGQVSGGTPVIDTWEHIAGSYDGVTQFLQLNGSIINSYTRTGLTITPGSDGLGLGVYYSTSYTFSGIIGEIRLSSAGRSTAWTKATYHALFDTLLTWSDPDRAAPWLGTWAYRRKFTISEALVDAELVDFPIALPIDASCGIGADDLSGLFTEVSTANKKKMAITLGDKVTECYFELENWDSVNSKGIIHTRGPIIRLGKDTELYIYYDSAQSENAKAGVPGDAIAAKVWDEDFLAVYHMAEDPSGGAGCILDSTVNGADGTPNGSMTTGDLVDGQHGAKAIDLDGTDDYIALPSGARLKGYAEVSVEVIAKITEALSGDAPLFYHSTTSSGYGRFAVWPATSGEARAYCRDSETGTAFVVTGSALPDPTDWHQHVGVLDSDINSLKIFIDGSEDGEDLTSKGPLTSTDPVDGVQIGSFVNTGGDEYTQGQIGEVRLSDIVRSAAWLKATYHTLFDTLGTWGSEEEIIAIAVSDDIIIILEAPAEITYSVPASLVSVSVEPGAPAEITYSVPGAAVASIGAIVGTPEITYSVPAATIIQNLNAIGIMSKPNVSARKPSATVTARKPSATATGSGPSATVTAKGD